MTMMMKKAWLALSFATVPLLVLACDHDSSPRIETTAGQGAAQPVNQHDIDAIATERCAREDRCGNIGDGRSYATRDVCMMKIRADNMNELTNGRCPRGIDPGRMQSCMTDIRTERCDHLFDTLSRVNSCAKDSLCP
jgi:hypothetical protein